MWRGQVRFSSCRPSSRATSLLRRGSAGRLMAAALDVQSAAGTAPRRMEAALYEDRAWYTHPSTTEQEDAWHVTVGSYNILADAYAMGYSNWLYREVPRRHLAWSHRAALITSELAHWRPDVVACQEVDHYHDLATRLAPLGYQGAFLQRSHGRTDGCATFWRPAALTPVAFHALHFTDHHLKDNVALFVAFKATPPATAAAECSPVAAAAAAAAQQEHLQQLLREAGLHSHLQGTNPSSSSSSSSSSSNSSSRRPSRITSSGGQQQQAAGGGETVRVSTAAAQGAPTSSSSSARQVVAAQQDCLLLVGNTHIIFKPPAGEVKLGQARVLLETAQQLAAQLAQHEPQQQQHPRHKRHQHQQQQEDAQESSSSSRRQVFAVLAGDFNAEPDSPLYTYMVDRQLDLTLVNRSRVADPQPHLLGRTASSGGGSSSSSGGSKVPRGYQGWPLKVTRSTHARQHGHGHRHTASNISSSSRTKRRSGCGGMPPPAVAAAGVPPPPALPAAPATAAAAGGGVGGLTSQLQDLAVMQGAPGHAVEAGVLGPAQPQQASSRPVEHTTAGVAAAQAAALSAAAVAPVGSPRAVPAGGDGTAMSTVSSYASLAGSSSTATTATDAASPTRRASEGAGSTSSSGVSTASCSSEREQQKVVGGSASTAVGRLVGHAIAAASDMLWPAAGNSSSSSGGARFAPGSIAGSSSSSGVVVPPPPPPRVYRWSDSEVKRASGHTIADLTAAAAPGSSRPSVDAGDAAAAAAAPQANSSSNSSGGRGGSSVQQLRAWLQGSAASSAPAAGAGPLLMTHTLPLQSSYMSVCGHEPDYTSSHTQFMDTCDYIWYTPVPATQGGPGTTPHAATASSSAAAQGVQGGPEQVSSPRPPQQQEQQEQQQQQGRYELQPLAVLLPPDGAKLRTGLPAKGLGSDHIMLVTRFQVTPVQSAGPC